MKKFEKLFVMIAIVLIAISLTGCGDGAVNAASDVKEKASEGVEHWTRHCDYQEWTNSTGTKIIINERRAQGDFEVIVEYTAEELNESGEYEVTYTDNAIVYMYVDNISEELISQLRAQ